MKCPAVIDLPANRRTKTVRCFACGTTHHAPHASNVSAIKCGAPLVFCECADAGCPAHRGAGCAATPWPEDRTRLYRIDMEDTTGTLMCSPCSDDAFASGVFTDRAPKRAKKGAAS